MFNVINFVYLLLLSLCASYIDNKKQKYANQQVFKLVSVHQVLSEEPALEERNDSECGVTPWIKIP